jgi:hypothetical protein
MKRKVTSQSFLMMLLILFGGMLMSQISMVGIFVYLALSGEFHEEQSALQTMLYVVPIVATLSFGLSLVLPSRWIATAADKPTLSEKLRGFQTATIVKMAMLEMPAVLGCVAFSMTGEFYFLAVNVVSVGLFATVFPSKNKLIESLRLDSSETALINDPSAVVMEYDVTNDD